MPEISNFSFPAPHVAVDDVRCGRAARDVSNEIQIPLGYRLLGPGETVLASDEGSETARPGTWYVQTHWVGLRAGESTVYSFRRKIEPYVSEFDRQDFPQLVDLQRNADEGYRILCAGESTRPDDQHTSCEGRWVDTAGRHTVGELYSLTYRRAVGPTFRLLAEGEKIQAGDQRRVSEAHSPTAQERYPAPWGPVTPGAIRRPLRACNVGHFRRSDKPAAPAVSPAPVPYIAPADEKDISVSWLEKDGYRLLSAGEIVQAGDEFLLCNRWTKACTLGAAVGSGMIRSCTYRRKIAQTGLVDLRVRGSASFNLPSNDTIVFTAGCGPVVTFHPDGRVSHAGYTPDEAARVFWRFVETCWPDAFNTGKLNARIADLERDLTRAKHALDTERGNRDSWQRECFKIREECAEADARLHQLREKIRNLAA